MNLTLNPLNSKTNSNEKIDINEVTLWEFYYYFINLKKRVLTASEITFLAYFTVDSDIEFICDKLKMQKSNYYGMLKRLKEKGFIDKIDEGYQLHFNIRKLKEYLHKNKSDITFTFPFTVNYDS